MVYTPPTRKGPTMAIKYRCYRECFAYKKHFKKGDWFPAEWIKAKYPPQPEYFVLESEYEDKVYEQQKEKRTVYSAADDTRSSAVLIEELSRFMEVPKDWNRKRIWMELKRREMAESKTDTGPRKPGRPALNKD
jgi:hypothetical protein